MNHLTVQKWFFTNLMLFIICSLIILGATTIGPTLFWPFGNLSEETSAILWTTRLPRVLLAALAGYALGVTGTSFQGLLQNPLADPYILGVSSGAALGSIISIAFGFPFSLIPFVSFAGALSAMLAVYGIASTQKQVTPHTLLLTGVVLNAFLFAFILLLNGLMSFEQSQKVLLLLIGNLETESFSRIGFMALFCVVGDPTPHARVMF
ncbi:MAG: iron chelate uptake ABC transporter family permease subunit [Deltaproteobacteria bacterium]|nr:MAG: iron chelate uptake ABC transporter family permease subunit [Deltaproteobacteria bacterium]